MAVSPPPTTSTGRPLKKAPSQVAQAETPRFRYCTSPGTPSHLAVAPVATMRVSLRTFPPLSAAEVEGPAGEVSRGNVFQVHHGTEPLGLLLETLDQLGPGDCLGEARVVLDVGGNHQLPAWHPRRVMGSRASGVQDRFQASARGVDGGGVAGRAGAEDGHLVDGRRHGGACPFPWAWGAPGVGWTETLPGRARPGLVVTHCRLQEAGR